MVAESRPTTGRFDSENQPMLQVIERTGDFVWLGVRDDFRHWLVTAA